MVQFESIFSQNSFSATFKGHFSHQQTLKGLSQLVGICRRWWSQHILEQNSSLHLWFRDSGADEVAHLLLASIKDLVAVISCLNVYKMSESGEVQHIWLSEKNMHQSATTSNYQPWSIQLLTCSIYAAIKDTNHRCPVN